MIKNNIMKSIKINSLQDEMLTKYNSNFNGFVNTILNKFLTENYEEFLDNEIKETKEILNHLKELKKNFKKELSFEEIEFFKETKNVLEKNPTYLKGRIGLYNIKFGKLILSEKTFLELVTKYG